VPSKPAAPTTEINNDFVKISWTIPFDGSSPVTSYKVKIRQNDGVTFTEDLVDCDGLQPSIIATLSCNVPIATLIVSPYNLAWGSDVYAVVSASNVIGTSQQSDQGKGAIILTNPDAPISLQNVPSVTLST
jgi:hypothetical protein